MRKIFILFIVSNFIIACNNSDNNRIITKIDHTIDSNKIRMDEAKAILDNANTWMEKGLKKSISKEKVNKEINLLMEKYLNLLEKMNKQDSIEIQNYRIEKINEIINLQMQQN